MYTAWYEVADSWTILPVSFNKNWIIYIFSS